jgi:hypothetical protein
VLKNVQTDPVWCVRVTAALAAHDRVGGGPVQDLDGHAETLRLIKGAAAGIMLDARYKGKTLSPRAALEEAALVVRYLNSVDLRSIPEVPHGD